MLKLCIYLKFLFTKDNEHKLYIKSDWQENSPNRSVMLARKRLPKT